METAVNVSVQEECIPRGEFVGFQIDFSESRGRRKDLSSDKFHIFRIPQFDKCCAGRGRTINKTSSSNFFLESNLFDNPVADCSNFPVLRVTKKNAKRYDYYISYISQTERHSGLHENFNIFYCVKHAYIR